MGCSLWGHKELDITEHAHTHKCIFKIATSILPAITQDSKNGVEGKCARKARQVLRQVFEQHDCWKAYQPTAKFTPFLMEGSSAHW